MASLRVEFLEKNSWMLLEDLTFDHPKYGRIVVEKGTVTDMDSVPRLPFAYWLTKNRTKIGATIHDDAYEKGRINGDPITRLEADELFNDVMKFEKVSWWQRQLIFRGVRAFGWIAWNKHRRNDDQEPGFV